MIRGAFTEGGGAVFKGIPYAQPPIGDLRWREPLPARAWAGIREATQFSPEIAGLRRIVYMSTGDYQTGASMIHG
jgi:carboxylesterase type B